VGYPTNEPAVCLSKKQIRTNRIGSIDDKSMKPLCKIELRSHHFYISDIDSTAVKRVCLTFAMKLMQYKLVPQHGQVVKMPDRVYASSNAQRSWFRFHINSWEAFHKLLYDSNISLDQVQVIPTPYYTPEAIEWEMATTKQARDYQQEILDKYILTDEPKNKLITFQTGRGKGLTLQLAVKSLKARLLLVVKPMYCEKWAREMKDVFVLDDKDVMVVQGSKAVHVLLNKALDGQELPKVVILSLATYQLWINLYETSADEAKLAGYACAPDELCSVLKIGVRAVDEVHMHFHQVFKTDLHTHVPKSICMSATLFNKDAFISSMYELMFPKKDRFKELELKKYINTTAVIFNYAHPDRIRTSARGSTFYNSGVVEESIRSQPKTLNNWLKLITHCVEIGYMQVTRSTKRLVIYAYLQDTVNLIVRHLQQTYPSLTVSSYISGDSLSNILQSHITVSTVGSAGTALDIPDLTNVILARDIASEQANVQLVGRLRQLPDDHPVQMHYLVAANMETSWRYYQAKVKLFAPRVAKQTVHSWGHPV
jgi:superfamily II DNA or RNA helicase